MTTKNWAESPIRFGKSQYPIHSDDIFIHLNTDHVGQIIQREREARNLSRAQLAERAGISARGLQYVEQGQHAPTLALLEKIATGLGDKIILILPAQGRGVADE